MDAKLIPHNVYHAKLIPSGYIGEPTGTKEIIQNGIHDVKEYAYADVKVPQPSGETVLTDNNTTYNVAQYESAKVQIPEEEKTVTPTTSQQIVTPTNGLLRKVTVEGVTAQIDPDIQPENIKQGVDILGKEGTLQPKLDFKYANFLDFDGELLYSYTEEEVNALTALPPLPTRNGIRYQEWNWTLEDIKSNNNTMFIGVNGCLDDSSSLFKIHLTNPNYLSPTLQFQLSGEIEVQVDWGDGTTENVSNPYENNAKSSSHTYSITGIKNIKIITVSGSGKINFNRKIFSTDQYQQAILEGYIGNATEYLEQTFNNCKNIEKVLLPNSITNLQSYAVANTNKLSTFVVSRSVSSYGIVFAQAAYGMKYFVIPYTCTAFRYNWFSNAYANKGINIHNHITEIQQGAFQYNKAFSTVFIPKSVVSIGNAAFAFNESLIEIDLSDYDDSESLPVLSNSNVFTNINLNAVFYVRNQSMLDAFTGATNWSTYAAQFEIGGKYGEVTL